MKKVLIGFSSLLLILPTTAQQLVRASHVKLVTTSSASSPLQITSKGGISFIGNNTSFTQHGQLTLLSNPIAGASDWLDSTTGVLTPATTGMINFRGTTLRQNVTGPTTFYGMTVNGIGFNLNQSNEVKNLLNLSNGLIYITNRNDSIYVSNPVLASINYTTDPFTTTSWVHGKLSRRCAVIGPSYFEFPIGKIKNGDSLYAPVKFEKQNANTVVYSAQYFPDTPVNRTSINPTFAWDHLSMLEFWELTSHGYAMPADNIAKLSLSWRTYSDVSSNPIHWDSLMIAHYLDPGDNIFIWEPEWATPLASIEPGSTINFGYFNNNKFIGDYSMPHLNFTIGTRTINNTLPVHLLDYQVQAGSNNTALNIWKVANDITVARYEVERAPDATAFTRLGNVNSIRTTGSGNYTFTDPNPIRGWNYYRLKIIEDNAVSYSPTRKLFIGSGDMLTIYPNPAYDHIYINLPPLNDKGTLHLINSSGQILSTLVPPSSTVRLSLSKLAAGVYYIRYHSGGNTYTKSFIHQN
jgi:hypothetical protein